MVFFCSFKKGEKPAFLVLDIFLRIPSTNISRTKRMVGPLSSPAHNLMVKILLDACLTGEFMPSCAEKRNV